MTPELWQKVQSAWDEYFETPSEQRQSFLNELRARVADVARELEALLEEHEAASALSLPAPPRAVLERVAQQSDQPLPHDPETVDYVSQADSVGDKESVDRRSPDDADMPEHIGRYRIDSKLGEGGMGVVYRGHDPDLNRFLAVKVLKQGRQDDADLCRRFLEEAQVMGQLQHPGIAPIHEIGALDDGRPFFSMKQIQGDTLAEVLGRRGRESFSQPATNDPPSSDEKKTPDPLSDLPRFVGIFEQICQTLAYAHSRGVLHRDLKPANIMVGAFGEVQVMDWGLAKRMKDEGGRMNDKAEETHPSSFIPHPFDTSAGVALGTPAYMAPEQARGEISELDQRADVFGLGAILCTILTGKPPFWSKVSGEAFSMAKKGDLDDAFARLERCGSDLELVELCKKCLAPDKADRARDADVVATAVAAYQEGVQEKLRQAEVQRAQAEVKVAEEQKRRQVEEAKTRAERQKRRWTMAAAVAFVLLIVGGAGGVFWYQHWERTRAAAHSALQDDMRSAVERADGIRVALMAELSTDKGIRKLLNRPTVWRGQINSAREALRRAMNLKGSAERGIDADLLTQIHDLEEKLNEDANDLRHALELEKGRQEYAEIVDGKSAFAGALKKYRAAFKLAGLAIDKDSPERMAERIGRSPISRALVAALDDCAFVAWKENQNGLRDRLLQATRQADTDPWRDRLREPKLWRDRASAEKLAGELLAEPVKLAQLAPQTLVLMGVLLDRTDAHERWQRRAHLLHPDDFWLAFGAAESLRLRKKHAQAAGFYRAALAIRPRNIMAWRFLGGALHASNDLPAAIDAFKKALAIDNQYAAAWNSLAIALQDSKKLPAAIDAFKKALAIDKKKASTWTNLGVARHASNDLPAAIDAFKNALAIDNQYAKAWHGLGLALHASNDLLAAISAFKKSVAIDKQSAGAWLDLGNALHVSKDLPAAIDAYKRALAIDKQYAKAWYNIGIVRAEQQRVNDAVAAFKKAVRHAPNDTKCWYSFGLELWKQKKLDEAIDAYKMALAIDNQCAAAWYNLGIAFGASKNLPAAIEAYKKFLAIDKQYAAAWYSIQTVDKQHAKAWYGLGIALRDSNDLPAAIDAFKKALAIDKQYARAWTGLGRVLRAGNDLPAAIDAHKKALAIDNQLAAAHANLGLAMRDQGEFTDAVTSLERALNGLPASNPVRKRVSSWHRQCQNLLRLQQRLRAVRKGEISTATEQLELGDFCQRYLRRYCDAAKLYAAAFTAEPKRADDLGKQHRYNAACAAALAPAGKGKDAVKLGREEKTKLRRQALDWLRPDLSAYRTLVEAKPRAAVMVQERMGHWQKDADLAGVRDVKWSNSEILAGLGVCHAFAATPLHHTMPSAIAAKACHPGLIIALKLYLQPLSALPEADRKQWQQFWSDVEALRKKARASYTETNLPGRLTTTNREQLHEVKLRPDKVYMIDMQSKQFNTLLRITTPDGKDLAENNDIIPGKIRNSRITFAPKNAGKYRLIASSNQKKGAGAYEIIIRGFAGRTGTAVVKNPPPKKDKPKPPPVKKTTPPKAGPNDITGKLTADDPLDTFPFTKKSRRKVHDVPLDAGKTYHLSLKGDFDTFLRIEDAAKKPLLYNDDVTPPGNLNSSLVFRPAKKGKYRIIVTSFQPANGAYTLKIREVQAAEKPIVINAKLTKQDIKLKGKFHKLHRIKLTAGRTYTIEMKSKSLDTFLVLLGPAARRGIAQNDDVVPGNTELSRIDFTPTKTATYTFLTTTYAPGQTGSYTLEVKGYRASE